MEFRYWMEDKDEKKNNSRFFFMSNGEDYREEFTIVQEWFPLFYSQGKSPRKEIIKWWKECYPERASNDKIYNKLCSYIKWWEDHTDFSKYEEKFIIISKTISAA